PHNKPPPAGSHRPDSRTALDTKVGDVSERNGPGPEFPRRVTARTRPGVAARPRGAGRPTNGRRSADQGLRSRVGLPGPDLPSTSDSARRDRAAAPRRSRAYAAATGPTRTGGRSGDSSSPARAARNTRAPPLGSAERDLW